MTLDATKPLGTELVTSLDDYQRETRREINLLWAALGGGGGGGGGLPLNVYVRSMTADETFVELSGYNYYRCFLNPNGANRNFNPSGSFSTGYEVTVYNSGNFIITFDSANSAISVGSGQMGKFCFDGSDWYGGII